MRLTHTGILSATLLLIGAGLGGPSVTANATEPVVKKGINMGNALEAPEEGDWGMVLREAYFEGARKAGFDSIRLPIRWNAHAEDGPPFKIDPELFERVDWAIDQALERDMAVIINIHHYDRLIESPGEQRERFLALWKQIAAHYRDYPPELLFELLNEPHEPLGSALWNDLLADALEVIRDTNPQRQVVVGPVQWNAYSALPQLRLPEGDRNLIVTFHYYLPFHFTHQGAEWVSGSDDWLGQSWEGTDEEKAAIASHFDEVAEWAEARERPVFLGEFGAYSRAEMESRVRWTRFVRQQAENRGFGWAYWEFGAGFGIYDRDRREWRRPLLKALIPESGPPAPPETD